MNVGIKVLAHPEFNEATYARMVYNFYKEHNRTTEIHVDSLVLLYKITRADCIFDVLFICHKRLLDKIAITQYNKYRRHLLRDDVDEIKSMIYGEFFRRVMFYKIPPDAPFSKYVKIYLTKWSNAYIKLMVVNRNRVILSCDNYEKLDY